MDYEKAYKEALERARYVLHTVETAGCAMHKDLLTEIFPELAESEDETIRKELMTFLIDMKDGDVGCFPSQSLYQQWIAYLEKQKEQKPAWSEEDGKLMRLIISILKDEHAKRFYRSDEMESGVYVEELVDFLENLRPIKQKWSDEDERMVRFYEDDYNNNLSNMPMRDVIENRIKFKDWLLNRLKSIRPQPKPAWNENDENNLNTLIQWDGIPLGLRSWVFELPEKVGTRPSWKPSEEQMEALQCAIVFMEIRKASDYDISPLKSLYEQLKKL